MMFTVAVIGGDGAGKTTIAKSLEQSCRLPIRYLYMGLSTQSSNIALPTSRLVLFFKRRSYRKMVQNTGAAPPERIPASYLDYRQAKHGMVWALARLLNRLAEAWYRQLVSLSYQARGYVVVYDRHFLFDTAPVAIDSGVQENQQMDRLYHWLITHWYPKPDLAILLDAPGQVLYERKWEATPDFLNRQREAYLEQGKRLNSFVRVDATRPLDQVLEEVKQHVMEFHASKRREMPWRRHLRCERSG